MIHNGTRRDNHIETEVVLHKVKNFVRDTLSGGASL